MQNITQTFEKTISFNEDRKSWRKQSQSYKKIKVKLMCSIVNKKKDILKCNADSQENVKSLNVKF